uniref:Uncharacterized protein n=1 Tax=Candidatus Kentrum sp. TC TaxID=2126339 RepID=A0A450Z3C5_9GAMM|nr:MAG: hypothetical protein BECKTC1821D_GA0114238_10589 [Candidatus Kentron sp. TC]
MIVGLVYWIFELPTLASAICTRIGYLAPFHVAMSILNARYSASEISASVFLRRLPPCEVENLVPSVFSPFHWGKDFSCLNYAFSQNSSCL